MIIEKAIQKFQQLQTNILFFFDEEHEYEEELSSYTGDDFIVIKVDKNYFSIKYRIEFEDTTKKILLYHTTARPQGKDYKAYPLIDLLLANQELLIDETADVLDHYKIDQKYAGLLKRYKRFVVSKKYQKSMIPVLSAQPFYDKDFYNTIISLIIEEKRTGKSNFNLIRIFEIMLNGEEEWEMYVDKIQKESLADRLKGAIYDVTSIKPDNIRFNSMKSLFLKLKYNAITRYFPEADKNDIYSKLKITDDFVLGRVEVFFKEWRDAKDKEDTLPIALSQLGADIEEGKIIETYGIDKTYGLETNAQALYMLQNALEKITKEPQWVLEKLSSWENQPEKAGLYPHQLSFIISTATYYNLRKNYIDFDFNYLESYIELYKQELYKLDLNYRMAYTAYQKLTQDGFYPEYESVYAGLNKNYDQFLIDLNIGWMKILEEKDFDLRKVKASRQFNFFRDFVATDDNKKVVIISDAFRYEIAIDLLHNLQKDPANAIEIKPMVASIPSYTSLGMSNLLPNNGVEVVKTENSIDYAIQGISTKGIENRAKILQSYEKEADTISYADFMGEDIKAQRDLLKKTRILYIYHNWIDTIGDDKQSEYYTFESAEDCILQLEKLINRLYRSLNTYNIIVTADHGFLFNYTKLPEASRQPAPDLISVLKEHTRFYVTNDTNKPKDSFLFPIAYTTNITSDENVVVPKAINRYRKKGNFGVQFVHGGTSLQEIIIPVLEIYRDRRGKSVPVRFRRLDETKRITSSSAIFKILQEEPVEKGKEPAHIIVGVYDLKNVLITNEVQLRMDSVDKNPSGRVFEFRLELNALGAKTNTGYLKAFNATDTERLNPLYINDLITISITDGEIDVF